MRRKPEQKPQPYFQKDDFTLFLGDCVEILKKFPDEYFDMIFADPPYHLSNDGITVHAGRMVSVNKGKWDKSNGIREDYLFHENWLRECRRVLKVNGTIWVSGTYHSIYACGLALKKLGYHILNDICWYKPNASPNISCRYFTASHETLIWARKSKTTKHKFNYKLAREGSWLPDFLKKPGKQMRSVWAIRTPQASEKKFGKHPTQKPLELLKRVILTSTDKGDLVLDPFTGSSTTGLAAYLYERKFVGIDTEKKYLDLSIKRFLDIQKQTRLKLPPERLPHSPQKKYPSQPEKPQTVFY